MRTPLPLLAAAAAAASLTGALAALSFSAPPPAAQAAAPQAAHSLADLAFLAGNWRGKQWGGDMEEHWLAPAGASILGVSRITRADTTMFFEFMRIEQAANNGPITLTVHVRGGQGTPFQLVECANTQAVFHNPTNDPSEILYRLEPDGSLFAHIKGEKNGKPYTEPFHLTRHED